VVVSTAALYLLLANLKGVVQFVEPSGIPKPKC
jgi:hypothetical protein